ncbi:MAG: YkgJ family cysteine cluster protein [Myxococcales bacterium]|nr:YkgJ family cysteine cluster protein [Myxococcales bacterium]
MSSPAPPDRGRRAPGRRPPVARFGQITQSECMRCGACCCNPASNAAEGFAGWVEVGEREPLLADERLVRRLVVRDEEGVAHRRLDPSGRCLALRGRLGVRVECTIYKIRPHPCRAVLAGSEECLRARAERGIV